MSQEKRSLRIAHVVGKLSYGGIESVVYNYYKFIDKEKVQFDILYDEDSSSKPSEEIKKMGATFIKVPPYQKLWKYIPFLIKIFKSNRYDIVHSHINTLSCFPLFAAYVAGIKTRVAHNHSVPNGNEFIRNVIKYLLRIFAKVFATDYAACSEKAGIWLFGKRTYQKGLVKVLKNAIDYNRFAFSEENKQITRSELFLSNKYVVGHIGRFTYAKNHNKIIEVFNEIKKRKPNSVLLLVGDGDQHDFIVKKLEKLGLLKDTILIGNTMNTEKYYSVMDVMLFPSIFEGLGLSVIEAQASKVPVVSSEAIPKEAKISNGLEFLSINKSNEFWADKAIALSEKEVSLESQSKVYDIYKAANNLEEWYHMILKCRK